MSNNSAYFGSKYNVQSACTHGEGLFEHESWCATRDPRMAYAYQIVADASKMTAGEFVDPAFTWSRLGRSGVKRLARGARDQ